MVAFSIGETGRSDNHHPPPLGNSIPELWECIDELEQEVATLYRENGRLRSELKRYKERDQKTRDWLTNKHWANANAEAKLIALGFIWTAGGAPGDACADRPVEWQQGGYRRVGDMIGVSESTVGRWQPVLDAAGLTPRTRTTRQWAPLDTDRMSDDGWVDAGAARPPKGEPIQWRTRVDYAPREGKEFADTWGQPALVPYPGPTRAHRKEATRQAEVRETVKRILAQCSECGSTDIDIVCHTCGTITRVDDIRAADEVAPGTVNLTPSNREEESRRQVDGSTPQQEAEGAATAPPLDLNTAAPVSSLAAVVSLFDEILPSASSHIEMCVGERPDKYTTRHRRRTRDDLRAHFEGRRTMGHELSWLDREAPSGRRSRWYVWDADEDIRPLLLGGAQLRRRGVQALVSRNPAKESSGHLTVILDQAMDVDEAIAALERMAPALKEAPERYPNASEKNGGRIRLPGGVYHPKDGSASRVVEVAISPEVGKPAWLPGTSPEGWAIIASAVTPAMILSATYVPPAERPEERPIRTKRRRAVPRRTAPPVAPGRGFDFAEFNARNPLESMVDVGRGRKFLAPWRQEDTPSVQLYDDGHWFDYGPGHRYGMDAFDLWCIMRGYEVVTQKGITAVRKAGIAALKAERTR